MESALIRSQKIAGAQGEAAAAFPIAATKLYLAKAAEKIESSARKVIAAVADGDMLRTQLSILRRLAKHDPYNVIELQQQIAEAIIQRGKYAVG
jgi:butyryl-CoA dehydrogenase